MNQGCRKLRFRRCQRRTGSVSRLVNGLRSLGRTTVGLVGQAEEPQVAVPAPMLPLEDVELEEGEIDEADMEPAPASPPKEALEARRLTRTRNLFTTYS